MESDGLRQREELGDLDRIEFELTEQDTLILEYMRRSPGMAVSPSQRALLWNLFQEVKDLGLGYALPAVDSDDPDSLRPEIRSARAKVVWRKKRIKQILGLSEVLAEGTPASPLPVAQDKIRCSYCSAGGRERNGAPCRVCEGRGDVITPGTQSAVSCTFCSAGGRDPRTGEPCPICRGLGVVTALGHALKVIRRDSANPSAPVQPMGAPYISRERIEQLRGCKPVNLDFKKLVRLCEEINASYSNGCFFAVLMLIRALLDHVAPVFSMQSFNEVANNYAGGGKSFRDAAQHLNGSARKIADSYLHITMRPAESQPTSNQVQFGPDLDFLIGELIRITPH